MRLIEKAKRVLHFSFSSSLLPLTCLSLSAAARPAGPPPTITTSNSRTSRGGRAGGEGDEVDGDDADDRANKVKTNCSLLLLPQLLLPPLPPSAALSREEQSLRSAIVGEGMREKQPSSLQRERERGSKKEKQRNENEKKFRPRLQNKGRPLFFSLSLFSFLSPHPARAPTSERKKTLLFFCDC